MFSRLFHFFETLVDPYTAYPDTDAPPRRLFAFLWDYSQPFKKLFAATAIMSLVVAADRDRADLVHGPGGGPAVLWRTARRCWPITGSS
jgi:hypothetical protein